MKLSTHFLIRGSADKSLVRPTSRCCRTESILSLERGVCSGAELQAFSCYRGWKGACKATRAISATSRRELSSSSPLPLQGKAPKEIHAILIEILGAHAPSYATLKNWVAHFKLSDFFTCDAPRPGRPKTVTTPEIIDQIHELILEYRRISAKSVAEQLGISHEWVGSIIHEELDMRKLFAKWVPKRLNADQKCQRCQSSEQLLEYFGAIQMISCRDWWPWTKTGYITMTRRQSNNQWSGSKRLTPPQKILSAKIRWKSSRLDFLGSRQHPPHWLPSKGPNYQRGVLLISAGAVEGHFEGKLPREVHHGSRVLTWQCPGSPGTCNPDVTGLPGLPVSWSPTLFPGSGPVGLPSVPWTEKAIERSPFFVRRGGHCCHGDLVGQTTVWIFFLSGLQKLDQESRVSRRKYIYFLEQRAKKCIELRGEYVE